MKQYRIKQVDYEGGYTRYVIQKKSILFGWQDKTQHPARDIDHIFNNLQDAQDKIKQLTPPKVVSIKIL